MEAALRLMWKMFLLICYIMFVYVIYYGVFTGLYCVFTYAFSSKHANKSVGNFFRYYWAVLSMAKTYNAKGERANNSSDYKSQGGQWWDDFYRQTTGTTNTQRDPFTVLGINEHTDQATAKIAYLKLVRMHHPDMGGTEDNMKRVNAAWDDVCKIKGWTKAHANA